MINDRLIEFLLIKLLLAIIFGVSLSGIRYYASEFWFHCSYGDETKAAVSLVMVVACSWGMVYSAVLFSR